MAYEILRLFPFMGISTHSTFWERKVLNHEWVTIIENTLRKLDKKMAYDILRLSPFMGISTHSTFWERKVLNHEWENNNREYSEENYFERK